MDSKKEEIIVEIVNWLIDPGQQSSYAEMITFLGEKTIAANPRLSKRQLMLFIDYAAFEMLNKNIPFRKAEEISPKQAIDPQLSSTISEVIEGIKIQREQDGLNTIDEVDIIAKPDAIPTRLQNFLMENGLNFKELFQTSQTELAKVPNFGGTTLSFIARCIEEKKIQFTGKKTIYDIVKDPSKSLLSTKSKRLLEELTEAEVDQIINLGPEFVREIPRFSYVGLKTISELYDYFKTEKFKAVKVSGSQRLAQAEPRIPLFAELSNEELELLLTPLNYINLKPRVRSALESVKIECLGQLALLDRDQFFGLPNAGQRSWREVSALVETYSLASYSRLVWPDKEEIARTIVEKNINVGKPFGFSAPDANTIEEEAVEILFKVLPALLFQIMCGRLGLGDYSQPLTLQDLAESKIISDKPITRERVRQLELKALKIIRERKINATLLSKLLKQSFSRNLILKTELNQEIFQKGFSVSGDPFDMIAQLCQVGFAKNDFVEQFVPLTGETLLLNQKKIDPKEIESFFKSVAQKLSGHAFARVDPTEFVGQRTDENDFQLALSSSQNLTCVKFEDLLYVAKKPKRLVTKKNKLVTALAKIFAVSKTSQTRDVFEGVSKSRYLHEKIPFDVFHEFLSRLDFFQLDEGMIQCNTPPAVSALTKGEMIIAQMAREADGILNSTNVHQTLIKNGIPSTSARQVVIHTPLLISLRRGAYRQEGLYKFVGNMDAVLQTDRGSKGADPDDFIVTIADDAKTRMFGRVTMTEKISIEGIVEVYDREENFICSVNIKGLTLTGLQPLLIGNQNRAITLIYDGSTKCFVVN